MARMGLNALLSFTSIPLHIVTLIGTIYVIFGFLLGVQTVWRWGSGGAITGFTTVILLMLVTGGLTLIGLGVMGEYIARIFDEVKRRPRYVIREWTGEGWDDSSTSDVDKV